MSGDIVKKQFVDVNGNLHCEDGPAIIWDDGSTGWYNHGQKHREDGPAFEWADGSKSWFYNNKRHRLDGPALMSIRGNVCIEEWWVDGLKLTKEEFLSAIRIQKITLLDDSIKDK